MENPREHLVRICKLAYDRQLLDSAGGNVTTRFGDRVYMTRSYAGGRYQWDLRPSDILLLDMEGRILEGEGEFSREGAVHMACYRAFPEVGCVFHAHSLNIMPFVAKQVPIPPMSEQTDKYGPIGFCEWAATHTEQLAVNVVAALRPQIGELPKHPVATMIPRHGIFVAGTDLNTTYDTLERLDRNAYIALMSRLLGMILTVTPNTGLDRVLFLPRLERNRRNQATDVVESMGGKGCDVSLILRELGRETVATGLAGGETGRRMDSMLRRAGVVTDFVWTDGDTRFNTVLIETETGGHTTICAAGLQPDEHALPGLLSWIERWAVSAEVVVLAGSLPESWPHAEYGRLVRSARAAGRPVVVDASGASLRAAVSEGVQAVKPNRHELESLYGSLPDREAVLRAARRLMGEGAVQVVVSLGEQGALMVSRGGAWEADALPVPVINPAGAGDGMTACLALGLAAGWDEPTTLRHAVAVSAAIVTTRGTAEVRRADVEALLPRVRVFPAG